MNLSKHSTFSIFILCLLLLPSAQAFGADAPTVKSSTTTAQSVRVATVNIKDQRIMSQNGNTFNIAFSISNKEGLQSGVKYGIQLVPESAKYIADEKVYDESVTLYENSTIKRELVYTAPSQLSGNYELLLMSSNESSFPFSVVSLGKVKLTASTKGIHIQNDSCYLEVQGEKGSPHYTLAQSVDISATEVLKLTCTAVNESSAPLSATPYYSTHYYSAYGATVAQVGGDYTAVSFAKNEKKTFSLVLPKGSAPQFYNLKVSLMNSTTSSNTISANYIIRGVNATLHKLSLDKDYYKRGDEGSMSLLWSASSGNFARSGAKSGTPPQVYLSATITSESGKECAVPIKNQLLKRNPNDIYTKIAFKAKVTCEDPKVSASITDDKGTVLYQKEFAFQSSDTAERSKPIDMKYVLIGLAILLAIVGFVGYMKKKKGANVTM